MYQNTRTVKSYPESVSRTHNPAPKEYTAPTVIHRSADKIPKRIFQYKFPKFFSVVQTMIDYIGNKHTIL